MHELLDMGYEFTLDDNLQEDLPQCNPCKDFNGWGKIGSHYNDGGFCRNIQNFVFHNILLF
jgi:hypothetical protein